MRSSGFPPIARADAQALILGSLPGQESLRRRQYYAQRRNAFWPIMGVVCGAHPALAYPDRCRKLAEHGIALWDVCGAAFRPGSLDSDIVEASVEANDFAGFFRTHPHIGRVYFNGRRAHDIYRRVVLPSLTDAYASLPLAVLPSTSPAHAALSLDRKLATWKAFIGDTVRMHTECTAE